MLKGMTFLKVAKKLFYNIKLNLVMKKILFILLFLSFCNFLFSGSHDEASIHIAKYKSDKVCAISYTFDDGLKEHYTMVAPELEKRGFRGTFWVNGINVNQDNNNIVDTTRVSWTQLKEMVDSGHEVSNHGWSHKSLTRISEEEGRVEIRKNDTIIFEKTGVFPKTFCYPYNAKNDLAIHMASENRVGTRTFQTSIGNKATPEYLDNWLTDLLEKKEWGVGMTHGITNGYDHFRNPQFFLDHLDKVKKIEDKVWVDTFEAVVRYTTARDSTQLTINQKKRKVEVTPKLDLDEELFSAPLTLVVNVDQNKSVKVKQGGKSIPVEVLSDKVIFNFNPYKGKINILLK